MNAAVAPARLTRFVGAVERLVKRTTDEAVLLAEGGALLQGLVAQDDWLAEPFARPDRERYRQYLLHRDPQGRFSVVSFVWGPGQSTPVHDHTVWGLVGVLRGAELSQAYEVGPDGLRATGAAHRLEAGQVEAVSPTVGDIHRVWNALDHRPSISIHLYGADIGQVSRHTYDEHGARKTFISGYSPVDAPSTSAA